MFKNDGNAKMILMRIDNNFGGIFLYSCGNLYISLIILEGLNNYDVYSRVQ